jgi:hypothetical protein
MVELCSWCGKQAYVRMENRWMCQSHYFNYEDIERDST